MRQWPLAMHRNKTERKINTQQNPTKLQCNAECGTFINTYTSQQLHSKTLTSGWTLEITLCISSPIQLRKWWSLTYASATGR